MGSAPADQYVVFRHDKLRFRDAFRLLFTKKKLAEYDFVDCSGHVAEFELGDAHADWTFALFAVVRRVLFAISTPLLWVGIVVEFFLNFWSLNGGLLGLIRRILTVSVTIPMRGSASYRSIIGHIDGRFDLYKEEDASHLVSSLPQIDSMGDIKLLDLTMMAAKIAYENPNYIKQVVNNCWKMHFVAFFDCWNRGEGVAESKLLRLGPGEGDPHVPARLGRSGEGLLPGEDPGEGLRGGLDIHHLQVDGAAHPRRGLTQPPGLPQRGEARQAPHQCRHPPAS